MLFHDIAKPLDHRPQSQDHNDSHRSNLSAKENPIMVTEKSKAIRITLNGTFGKCPEIIIGMAS